MIDLRHLQEVAQGAAARGAELVARRAGSRREAPESKGAGDYVSAADRESEEAIRDFLSKATPDIPVVGEEQGGTIGDDPYWAVDPLDGTTNFLIGMPVVAVSVALMAGSAPVAGAVRAPLLGLSFAAARGLGAWSGSTRLRVSERPVDRGIVATGFPFRDRTLVPAHMPVMHAVFARVEDLRRAGAAAMDLVWVAAGVFDGYFELSMSVWDIAAGVLMVEEAGGTVTDWQGGDDHIVTGNVLAGSPATHAALLDCAGVATGGQPQE